MVVRWNYPTDMRLDCGGHRNIGDYCQELGIQKPLIVTDSEIRAFSWFSEVLQSFSTKEDYAVFDAIVSNPNEESVHQGLALMHAENCDAILAIGGGSAIDVGKAIALLWRQECSLWDLEDIGDNWKKANIDAIAPIIALPTTAGTGSEVGRASVITDSTTQTKKLIFHPNMLPSLVVLDAELTIALPPPLTAATGMDALSHSLEALCASGYHPMADGIAMEAILLIYNNLAVAYENGLDIQARQAMLYPN